MAKIKRNLSYEQKIKDAEEQGAERIIGLRTFS